MVIEREGTSHMCGIVGYIGPKTALPILMEGLQRLEYRGYDSAGIGLVGQSLWVVKKKGKVDTLQSALELENEHFAETLGIGHTRWATHGEPSDTNAHPHTSIDGRIALVHNGIIENYLELKVMLENRGVVFKSQTDTEVLVHLIHAIQKRSNKSFPEIVRLALNRVVGAYAIAVVSLDEPDILVVARKGSPLAIGVGAEELYIGSDVTPFLAHTKHVQYLKDGDVATLSRDGTFVIHTLDGEEREPFIEELTLSLEAIQKGEFPHFMLKEIHEQPKTVRDSMRGRLYLKEGRVVLGGIREYEEALVRARRIIFVACGTSFHAALIGEHLFENYTRIPTEVEYASEFRYRNPVVGEGDVVIAVSQSGETADTLAAIEYAKARGAIVLGITNVVGSSIARATHAGSYTHAGPEIGVASTKAFTAQVTVMILMALHVAMKKGTIQKSEIGRLLAHLDLIPEQIQRVLALDPLIQALAKKYRLATSALYLGRGYGMPVALEGALKLKEISYVHAEGYPAGEMKHGPIALIEPSVPTIVIATESPQYEKVLSNMQEIKARGGPVIAVVTEGATEARGVATDIIEIPRTEDAFSPILATIPLQLFSYYSAVLRGTDVDQPRNLAKSVTVE